MSQRGLFDREASDAARDEAIGRVDRAADDDWKEEALSTVRSLARTRPFLTADDVWRIVSEVREPRALGAVMTRARRKGWIEPTEDFEPTERVVAHSKPMRIWRSLLYGGGAAKEVRTVRLTDGMLDAIGIALQELEAEGTPQGMDSEAEEIKVMENVTKALDWVADQKAKRDERKNR